MIENSCSDTSPGLWFAVRVKSNCERMSACSLDHKGYETFLPTYRCRKRKWGKSMELEIPLFPSYLFCRFCFQHRLPILITPGVVHIVGSGSGPIPVPEDEIAAVRAIVQANLNAEPWPFLKVGQAVRIVDGPLTGVEGILVNIANRHRLVVSVSLLQRSVAAVIEGGWVDPAPRPFRPATAAASRYAAAGYRASAG
jgi:transcription antitermination factor NusG